MAGRAVRRDGQHFGCPTIYPTDDQTRPREYRLDFEHARGPGRGSLEVRAPASILHGIERLGGQIARGMSSGHLYPNDGNGTVDISMCGSQNTQRMSRY